MAFMLISGFRYMSRCKFWFNVYDVLLLVCCFLFLLLLLHGLFVSSSECLDSDKLELGFYVHLSLERLKSLLFSVL